LVMFRTPSLTGKMYGMNQEIDDPRGLIIPPELAVKAMRDSGYRNTAYALAVLISTQK